MLLGLLEPVRLCWDKRKVSGRALAELGLRGGEGFASLVGTAYDRGLRRVGYAQADGHISAISETADSVVRGRLHTVRVTAVTMRSRTCTWDEPCGSGSGGASADRPRTGVTATARPTRGVLLSVVRPAEARIGKWRAVPLR